jgi:hypothetical protein
MDERLRDERKTNAKLQRLWAVMREYYSEVLHLDDALWLGP